MLCTLVLNGVVSALRALSFDVGKEFTVVTFSFNPRESSELAAATQEKYLGEYRRPGAAAGWRFLTAGEEPIRQLTEAIGFRYAYDAAHDQFAHAAGIVVLTPEGTISRYFYGVEFAPREHRLGSLVDQLLLFCFHYDPATGRYSTLALGAVRWAGLATVLGLAGGVLLMLRREARGVRAG
jgi:protein SCO1/2